MAAGQIPQGWNATSDWEHVGQPFVNETAGGPKWYALNRSYSEAAPGGGVYWVEQYEPEGPTSNPAVGTYWRRILMEQQPAQQQPPPGGEGQPPPGGDGQPPKPGGEGPPPAPAAPATTVGGANPDWVRDRIAEAQSIGVTSPAGGWDAWLNDGYWTPYRIQNEINQFKAARAQAGTDTGLQSVAETAVAAAQAARAAGEETPKVDPPAAADGSGADGGPAADDGKPADGSVPIAGTGLEQQRVDIEAAQQAATQRYQEGLLAGETQERAMTAAIAVADREMELAQSMMELRASPRDALLWSNIARGGGNAFYQTPARFIGNILGGQQLSGAPIGGGATGTQNAGVPTAMGLPPTGGLQNAEVSEGLPNWRLPTEFELTSGQVQSMTQTERQALEGGMELMGRSPADVLRSAYALTGRYGATPFVQPSPV
jgi:hypothetical protein